MCLRRNHSFYQVRKGILGLVAHPNTDKEVHHHYLAQILYYRQFTYLIHLILMEL